MAQFYIAQPNIVQRKYFIVDRLLVSKKVQRIFNGHIEHVCDVLAVVFNLKRFLLEALTVTAFTLQVDVGHELHFNFDLAFTFARFAPAAFHIERKVGRLISALLGERLIAAGYFDAHADRYVRRFALADTRVVEVKEAFPRLTPGSVPLGVTRATYEIDLDKAAGPSIPAADALKRLGAI